MEGDLAHIGAGLAAIGSGAAAIGVGNVAGNFLAGALRNPSAAASQTATLFIGIAFAEALGIFAFLVSLLLMFAVYSAEPDPYAQVGPSHSGPSVVKTTFRRRTSWRLNPLLKK